MTLLTSRTVARGMGEEPYMGTTVGPELVKALNDTLDLGPVDVHGFNYTANATVRSVWQDL